jgi:hypothetical protein
MNMAMHKATAAVSPAEACDMCHTAIAEAHQHVLDPALRKLECVCDACAILFSSQGQTKYRRVPRRIRALEKFALSEEQWDSLQIPIGIAFLFHSSRDRRVVAMYPSPGGGIESQLPLDAWAEIEAANPQIGRLDYDVEGVLIYRMGGIHKYFVIPVDECFRLIGLVRLHWKGFTGGAAVRKELQAYMDALERKAR